VPNHRQLVLHTLDASHALAHAPHATFSAGDVYMPITPMFHVHAWGLPSRGIDRRTLALMRPVAGRRLVVSRHLSHVSGLVCVLC
jgi:acyl-CoA synthetase (AMP-forming)/AMP-acid ligase II